MTDATSKIGESLRLVASRGWADVDADVAADLLDQAHELAGAVVADQDASPETRTAARDLLDALSADRP